MKRSCIIVIASGLVFLFCNCSNNKRDGNDDVVDEKVYTPIVLYFSPAEDYLMSQRYFPNFINYPDDRIKLGLKGDVKKVEYKTTHLLSYTFSEEGKIQSKIFSSQHITDMYEHTYSENDYPIHIIEKNEIIVNGVKRASAGKKIDKITAHTISGKPLIREVYEFNNNNINHILCYKYDQNDICRSVGLADNSPVKKSGSIPFYFECDENGLITYIHAGERIPYRLTSGERKIYPSYDSRGFLVSLKEMAIPTNMEAYRIDSIASETHYKYNKEGDVEECIYDDIVYPGNDPNSFTLKFSYEYDKYGNWITKRIIGNTRILHAAMNSYYNKAYTINRIKDENDAYLGEIIIEREINYYEDENTL